MTEGTIGNMNNVSRVTKLLQLGATKKTAGARLLRRWRHKKGALRDDRIVYLALYSTNSTVY